VLAALILVAAFGPWLSPYDPMAQDLGARLLPPSPAHPLGTDDLGRDILTRILHGSRITLMMAALVAVIAGPIGLVVGASAGYLGGWVDALVMRVADVFLSLPTILLALLVAGIARAVIPGADDARWAPVILIAAIAVNEWVQYARTVRAATMVEASRDYVRAVRIMGLPVPRILFRHVLPNVIGPILVISTINLAAAVLTEATLSFLGVGMPPDYPSLGTLIRIGNEYAFSGIWWITVMPSLVLVMLVLSVNIVGDWLRDLFNPRLQGRA
jgi:peptide/nickel transport system permease protein